MAKQEMTLPDWFDDLCVRFILNLPVEERSSLERICFQIEEAQWYYEDFIRPLNPSLPSMNLKPFSQKFFQHIFEGVGKEHYLAAFSRFVDYKTRVPVRGAILLNQEMDQVVLVKGWKKGARWSFPRGKINREEKDLDCAVREVFEETGLDLNKTDLLSEESKMKSIKVSMREQEIMVYIVRGVHMDTVFEPQTRKEISDIAWYRICDLPTMKGAKVNSVRANMFYMVAPFVGPLMKWIDLQHKLENTTGKVNNFASASTTAPAPTQMSEFLDSMRQAASNATKQSSTVAAPVLDKSAELMKLLNIGATEPRFQYDNFSSRPQLEPASLVPSGILSNSTPTFSYSQPVPTASVAPTMNSVPTWPQHQLNVSQRLPVTQQASLQPQPIPSSKHRSASTTFAAVPDPSAGRAVEPAINFDELRAEFSSSMPLSKHSQALLSIFTTPSPRPSTINPVAPVSVAKVPAAIEIPKLNRNDLPRVAPAVASSGLTSSEHPLVPVNIPEVAPPSGHPMSGSRAVSGPVNPRASNQDRRGTRRGRGGGSGGKDTTRRASEFRPNPQKPITILSRPKPPVPELPSLPSSAVPVAGQASPPVKIFSPPPLRSAKSAMDIVSPSKAPSTSIRNQRSRNPNLKEGLPSANLSDEDHTNKVSPTKSRTRHRSRSRRRTATANRAEQQDAQKMTPVPSIPASTLASLASTPVTATQPQQSTNDHVQPTPSPAEASNKNFFLGFLASLKR